MLKWEGLVATAKTTGEAYEARDLDQVPAAQQFSQLFEQSVTRLLGEDPTENKRPPLDSTGRRAAWLPALAELNPHPTVLRRAELEECRARAAQPEAAERWRLAKSGDTPSEAEVAALAEEWEELFDTPFSPPQLVEVALAEPDWTEFNPSVSAVRQRFFAFMEERYPDVLGKKEQG